ncbi:23182_t:CDS:2, partial [Racocetra persica]
FKNFQSYNDYETNENSRENLPTVLAVKNIYEDMVDDKKWKLFTGKVVEDTL